jgi:hypothetical protein
MKNPYNRHPGESRLVINRFNSRVKVEIANNLGIIGGVYLTKSEALDFALDLLSSIRNMEE